MQLTIPYLLNKRLAVILKDKNWWLDAHEIHKLICEPYSLIMASELSGYRLIDGKMMLSFDQVAKMIKSPFLQDTLFKDWFDLTFKSTFPRALKNQLELLSGKTEPVVKANAHHTDFQMDLSQAT